MTSFPVLAVESMNSSNPLIGMEFLRVRIRLKLIFCVRQRLTARKQEPVCICNKTGQGSTFQSMGSRSCSFRYVFVSEKWWWLKNVGPLNADRGEGYP